MGLRCGFAVGSRERRRCGLGQKRRVRRYKLCTFVLTVGSDFDTLLYRFTLLLPLPVIFAVLSTL